MNLMHLKTFCEIVKRGNAARAATALFLEPTAVSMQLNKLESELGGNLFDRSYRPMKLTPLGEYLYPRALNLLTEAEKLEKEVKDIVINKGGWLGIGFTRATMFSLLPNTIRRFGKTYPDVQIDLMALQSEQQPAELQSGRIQVGVSRFRGPYNQVDGLNYTHIRQDPFVVALYKGHPLASKKSIKAAELNGMPRIAYPKVTQSHYDEQMPALLEEASIHPSYTYYADDIYIALEMVTSGLGYCLIIRPFGESNPNLVFVELSDIHAVVDVVAVTKNSNNNPLTKAFVECLVNMNQEDKLSGSN